MASDKISSFLWNELKNGNEQALNQLYNLHYVGLMNYGHRFTTDKDIINDCLSEVLLSLWEKRKSLPEVQFVRSYLCTFLRRQILHYLKTEQLRDKKELFSMEDVNLTELSYEEQLNNIQADKALQKKLFDTFEKLSGRQIELLKMKFFEDLDYDEIAIRCNITKRTAYNIVHSALNIIRNEFSNDTSNTSFSNILLLLLAFN